MALAFLFYVSIWVLPLYMLNHKTDTFIHSFTIGTPAFLLAPCHSDFQAQTQSSFPCPEFSVVILCFWWLALLISSLHLSCLFYLLLYFLLMKLIHMVGFIYINLMNHLHTYRNLQTHCDRDTSRWSCCDVVSGYPQLIIYSSCWS